MRRVLRLVAIVMCLALVAGVIVLGWLMLEQWRLGHGCLRHAIVWSPSDSARSACVIRTAPRSN